MAIQLHDNDELLPLMCPTCGNRLDRRVHRVMRFSSRCAVCGLVLLDREFLNVAELPRERPQPESSLITRSS